ncbi:MAG: hypothetical protein ABIN97_17235 [Ginsengibacter sp.]
MKKLPKFYVLFFIIFNFFISSNAFALMGNIDAHDPSTIVKDGTKYWRYSTGNGIYALKL